MSNSDRTAKFDTQSYLESRKLFFLSRSEVKSQGHSLNKITIWTWLLYWFSIKQVVPHKLLPRNLVNTVVLNRERHLYSFWVWVCVYWCFTSHTTIFQSYMWRHRCAGGLKKKLYLRSGSQRHRHFAGFFNVPVLHWHGTTLFIQRFRHTTPFNRLLRHAGDTEDVFST